MPDPRLYASLLEKGGKNTAHKKVCIGGWGVLPTGKSISVSVALALRACVRASERSCVREMIPQWLGLAARICGTRPVVVVVVRAAVPIESSSFLNSDRCILIAMTQ